MPTPNDIGSVLDAAASAGRGAFTEGDLRVNVVFDKQKGWLVIATCMAIPGMRNTERDNAHAGIIASALAREIRARKPELEGGFERATVHEQGGSKSWVFKWGRAPSELSAPDVEPDRKAVERLVVWARAHPDPEQRVPPHREVANGWSVILTRHLRAEAHEPGQECWHFSAMLYPGRRSSSEGDWAMLGRLMAHVQHVLKHDTQPQMLDERTNPNAAQHFIWHTDGSKCPLAETVRVAAKKMHEHQGLPNDPEPS